MNDAQEPQSRGFNPDLGYDPQPELKFWRGTPIPPVDRPLALTPARAEICDRVWWWGGPENALRNCRYYIYHVIDHGNVHDWKFTVNDVEHEIWLYALNSARQGNVSRGGHRLFSIVLGGDVSRSDEWSLFGHKNDGARMIFEAKWLRERGRIIA